MGAPDLGARMMPRCAPRRIPLIVLAERAAAG
jgi:hypothetical protein